MKRTRQDDIEVRKQQIIHAAVALAMRIGYKSITKKEIAKAVGVSASLISHYYRLDNLQDEVLRYALKNDVKKIIAQGICFNDRLIKKLSKDQKRTVLRAFGV